MKEEIAKVLADYVADCQEWPSPTMDDLADRLAALPWQPSKEIYEAESGSMKEALIELIEDTCEVNRNLLLMANHELAITIADAILALPWIMDALGGRMTQEVEHMTPEEVESYFREVDEPPTS